MFKPFYFFCCISSLTIIGSISTKVQQEIICDPNDPSTWGQLYANPENLTTFFECTPDGLQMFSCPDGLIFPIGGTQCDYPYASSTLPTSITTTPSTANPTTMMPTTTSPTTATLTTTPTTTTQTTITPTTTTPTTTQTTTTPTTTTPTTTTTTTPTTTTPTTTTPTTTTPTTTTPTTTTPTTTTPSTTTEKYKCTHTLIRGKVGTWYDAMAECGRLDQELTTVDSEEEYRCLLDLIQGENETMNYWTSGNDLAKEGIFVWETRGEAFTIFYPEGINGQPDNAGGMEHCVSLRKVFAEDAINPYHFMNDEYCTLNFSYICKEK